MTMTQRTTLGEALRELHMKAGSPSYRQIATRTRYSEYPLSHTGAMLVLTGGTNPRWGTIVALVRALRGDPNDFRDLWEAEQVRRVPRRQRWVPANRVNVDQVKEEARRVYEATQCYGTGCCGDLEGALDLVIARFTEAQREEAA
jgi:hypothetical protein